MDVDFKALTLEEAAAHRADALVQKRLGHHIGRQGKVAAANRQVDAIAAEKHRPTGRHQTQFPLGPHRRLQQRQAGNQPANEKGGLARQHQRPAHALGPARTLHGGVQTVQRRPHIVGQHPCGRSGHHRPVATLKQRKTQCSLHVAHGAAHSAIGEMQLSRRARDAAMAHGGFKRTQGREVGKPGNCIHHITLKLTFTQ